MHEYRFDRLCIKRGLRLLATIAALYVCGCGAPLTSAPSASPGAGGSSQPRVVSAPVLGFAWDSTALVLRQIDGVPGAAKVDASGDIGSGFAMAVASGSHDYALLLNSKGALYLATLPGGTPRQISAGTWSGLAISASGGYAIVYAASGTAPQLISGLPQQPAFHNMDGSPAGITAAAVADDGTALLAAHANGGGVALLAVPLGGTASRVMTVGAFGGMAFVPGTDRALVADAASGTVTQLSNMNGAPSASLVSGAKIAQPVGLDISADGRWALAANGLGTVLRIDLSGQAQPETMKCNCVPTTVAGLSGSAFRLTEAGTATGWMVDAGGASPRVLFIPALPGQKQAGGGQ